MADRSHTWRVIAQYDVTAQDAQRLAQGIPGYEGRPPERVAVSGVGRNDLCPCGSGKKFKRCRGA